MQEYGGVSMTSIGFAVVGCGAIGAVHAEAISNTEGAVLRAVSDVRPDAASALASRFGCDAVTDPDALFARSDVDAVVICTPSGLHAETAQRAAAAGKHVVCEKPLDTDLGRARATVRACRENGVMLFPVFQRRFDPAYAALASAVGRGALGRIAWGSAHVILYRDDAYYRSGSWRGTAALDGGALMNQSIHTIDMLLGLMGRPVSVRGRCARRREGIETEDVGVACLEFADGALGSVEGTTAARPGICSELAVYGSRGSVILRNDRIFFADVPDAPELGAMATTEVPFLEERTAAVRPEGHMRQYRDILAALRGEKAPSVTAEDGLLAVETVLRIYAASRLDRTVFFDEPSI